MIGFPPHKFLCHHISSVAASVMCRTCNLMVGVQYQPILNFFFLNFFFLGFFSNFFKGLLKRKEKNTASRILLFKKKNFNQDKVFNLMDNNRSIGHIQRNLIFFIA